MYRTATNKQEFELKEGCLIKEGDRVLIDGKYKTIKKIIRIDTHNQEDNYPCMVFEDNDAVCYSGNNLFDVEGYEPRKTSEISVWSENDRKIFAHPQFSDLVELLKLHANYDAQWNNYHYYPRQPIEWIQYSVSVVNFEKNKQIKDLQCKILDDCQILREQPGDSSFDSRMTGVFIRRGTL